MLILTRRLHKSIVIGDRLVTITIVGIQGHQIRLGIDAPKNIKINRAEVLRRIEMRQQEDSTLSHEAHTHEPT